MRKIKLFVLSVVIVLFTACHGNLWDAIDDLDARVAKLEELCKEMNTNISALQTIVEVIQDNDFITGIVPIEKGGEVIGYTIMFGKHEPITIYNGEDGKDGQNGSGSTPIIGVTKDTDGVYYWTLNGEWLLDDEGNKLPVSGKNGNDGENGEGSDGESGTIGKDGVTPQLKIENGYWYISYDNGATWTELGKAVGEDGEKGDKGDKGDAGNDGQNGDSMFTSVTYDDNNVYFTLTDGSVLIVPLGSSKEQVVQIIDGAIMAEFSVSETKKVYFSKGNLQYISEGTHKCADGTAQPGTWRFAEKQWEEGTLLYWGNSGYNDTIKQVNSNDWFAEAENAIKYYKAYEIIAKSDISDTYNDWGVYNAIENGGNIPNKYRTLTRDEWVYLWEQRPNAKKLRGTTIIDGIECTYILPDSCVEAKIPPELYSGEQIYECFSVNALLDKGVVFFRKNPKKTNLTNNSGEGYWSSTYTKTYNHVYYAYAILGGKPEEQVTYGHVGTVTTPGVYCLPVRLVKDVE